MVNEIELKNYVHNYETGKTVELIKYKPYTGAKGTAKIELFNAETGDILLEAKTENVINNAISKQAFMYFFYYLIRGTGGNYAKTMFGRLVLTDYTGAEDANAMKVSGNLIGWANKSAYSGNSIVQGSINLAETTYTMTSDGHFILHFVFDFPTQAANGTFSTLWWTEDYDFFNYMYYDSDYATFPDNSCAQPTSSRYPAYQAMSANSCNQTWTRYIEATDDMYCVYIGYGSNASRYVSSINNLVTGMQRSLVALKKADGTAFLNTYITLTGAKRYDDCIIGYVYRTTETTTSEFPTQYCHYIFTWDLNGNLLSINAFPDTVTKNGSISFNVVYRIILNKQLVLVGYYSNADGTKTNRIFYISAPYSSITSTIDLDATCRVSPPAPPASSFQAVYNYFLVNSDLNKAYIQSITFMKDIVYIYWYHPSAGSWYMEVKSDFSKIIHFLQTSANTLSYYYILFFEDTNRGIAPYSYNGFGIGGMYPFSRYLIPGAQTLLASPVTKLATNTMKIQYDITIDKVEVVGKGYRY